MSKSEFDASGTLLYLRYTDKDGRHTVLEHRCWDAALFYQTRSDEAKKARDNGDEKVRVELSNDTDYKKARGR